MCGVTSFWCVELIPHCTVTFAKVAVNKTNIPNKCYGNNGISGPEDYVAAVD